MLICSFQFTVSTISAPALEDKTQIKFFSFLAEANDRGSSLIDHIRILSIGLKLASLARGALPYGTDGDARRKF